MVLKRITFIKLVQYISLIYILSFSIHYWSVNFIKLSTLSFRVSELVFLILLALILFGFINKKINLFFIKSDIFFLLLILTNSILIILGNFNTNYIQGLIASIYLFLIYFIYRNIFNYIEVKLYLKAIVYLSILSGLLGIIGWLLYQLNINNIFAVAQDYPLSIGKKVRASGLFINPTFLAFILIIGLNIFLFTNKNKTKTFYLIFIILNLALLLTFSKSIVLYLICLILIYYKKTKVLKSKYIIIIIIFLLFFFHSFLTSFLLLSSKKNYENISHIKLMFNVPIESKPIYLDNNFILYASRYTFLKFKSAEIIKNNYLLGIGYNNFKEVKYNKYPFVDGAKPHSTYLGILSELGILGLISIVIMFIYVLIVSIKHHYYKNNFLFIIILYLIFESIHFDIITIKIIWIIFALTIFLKNNNKYPFNTS